MRTTIDIDEDVLLAAKELARAGKRTLGQIISDLARKAMTREMRVSKKHGLPLFPVQAEGTVVTLELVNQLRDENPLMVYLLDVNVLLALCDSMHIHHKEAHAWFAAKGRNGWATCPLTENGFVRVASHPGYPNRPGDVSAVMEVLRQLRETANHSFWPDEISILDVLEPQAVVTHTHITDVYLLGLALKYRGKLATLDQRIPVAAVRGGREAIEFIASR